jgi:hypothetical protein
LVDQVRASTTHAIRIAFDLEHARCLCAAADQLRGWRAGFSSELDDFIHSTMCATSGFASIAPIVRVFANQCSWGFHQTIRFLPSEVIGIRVEPERLARDMQ